MRKETFDLAVSEAKRFLEASTQIKYVKKTASWGTYYAGEHGPKQTGAIRRASMDLTRALAEMRKTN